jgi:phasin family protein
MTDFREQAAVAQWANLDFIFGLAGTMLEGEENLVQLNLDTTKTTFANWYQRVQDGLAKTDGQEVPGQQNALVLPSVERVLTYERQVAEIASAMQTQLAEVVNAQYLEVSRQVQLFVQNIAQKTPVGSEAAIAFLNQGFSLFNTAYENAQNPTKQAVDVVQNNMSASAKAASEVTEAADEAAKKTAKAARATEQ